MASDLGFLEPFWPIMTPILEVAMSYKSYCVVTFDFTCCVKISARLVKNILSYLQNEEGGGGGEGGGEGEEKEQNLQQNFFFEVSKFFFC